MQKQIDPPFRPKVRSEIDTRNFEKKFSRLRPIDSFVNSKMSLHSKMDMNYVGFTFAEEASSEAGESTGEPNNN